RSRSPVLVVPPSAVLGAAAVRGFGVPGVDLRRARGRRGGGGSCYEGPAPAGPALAAGPRPRELTTCTTGNARDERVDMLGPRLEIADIFRRHGEEWS